MPPADDAAAAVIDAAQAAPVEAAPVEAAAAPVVEAVEAAPAEAVAEAAPAEEAAPAAEEPGAAEPASLVEAAADTPPEEAKPAEPEAPAEPVLPTYEAFTLPEGLQAAPEQIEAFTSTIGKYGLSQEAGQELMDLHGTVLRDMQTAMDQRQRDIFAETRAGWRADFAKTAGNRANTLAQDAKWVVNELVTDPEQRKQVWSVFDFTGVGDHPAVINLLAKAAGRMRERPAPVAGLTPNRQAQNKADQRYGASRQTS